MKLMLKAFVKKADFNYTKVLEFFKAKQPQIKLQKGLMNWKGYWIVTHPNLDFPKLFFGYWGIEYDDYPSFNRSNNFLASELENQIFELKVLINGGDTDKLPDLLDAFMGLSDLIADKALKPTTKKAITLPPNQWDQVKAIVNQYPQLKLSEVGEFIRIEGKHSTNTGVRLVICKYGNYRIYLSVNFGEGWPSHLGLLSEELIGEIDQILDRGIDLDFDLKRLPEVLELFIGLDETYNINYLKYIEKLDETNS